jgi:fumarate hydratase subunit beta
MNVDNLSELYCESLIINQGQVTYTGLSSMMDGTISHGDFIGLLANGYMNKEYFCKSAKPICPQTQSKDAVLIMDKNKEAKPYLDENKLITKGHYTSLTSIKPGGRTAVVYIKQLNSPLLITCQIFKNGNDIVASNLASIDLNLSYKQITTIYNNRWEMEEYYKSIKHNASFPKSLRRIVATQKNHFNVSISAFKGFGLLKASRNKKHDVVYFFASKPAKPTQMNDSANITAKEKMDSYVKYILISRKKAMIGGSSRFTQVIEDQNKNKAIHFITNGDAVGLISECIIKPKDIANPEIGAEAVRKIEMNNMPFVAFDNYKGNDLPFESRKRMKIKKLI